LDIDNSLNNNNQRLALSTFTKLVRAAETITTEVHAGLTTHNLTISQFGVLEALHYLGPMCQQDIAKNILKSTGNITMVIDNLEKQELVTRKRNENDRRFFEIHLTAEGDALISDVFPAHAKRIVKNMARLSKTEQLELGRLYRKFKKTTQRDNKKQGSATINIIRAQDRYFTDLNWLKTYWLFSFNNYYDPQNLNHGSLRVFNDDIVAEHTGFDTHPHEEMEIISLVLDGEMEHRDTMGNQTTIRTNDVQQMTAGKGLQHSDKNTSDAPLHFFQI